MSRTRPDVEPVLFRQLLGRFATGVTVLTTRDDQGRPVGMTASSLTSVSLSPPLVSVCVDVTADMHRVMSASGDFVVNVLAAHQRELARRFAQDPAESRFQAVKWRETPQGLVVLEETLAHIECERFADFPLGDHTLFVGRVTGGAMAHDAPLLYFRGEYRALGPA
ncbi:MAG TPA: flavin reductase family protein [Gemmatimonadales bacterium]|nr:flavin reductase family protein [Gemmatimonadales bacterium]